MEGRLTSGEGEEVGADERIAPRPGDPTRRAVHPPGSLGSCRRFPAPPRPAWPSPRVYRTNAQDRQRIQITERNNRIPECTGREGGVYPSMH